MLQLCYVWPCPHRTSAKMEELALMQTTADRGEAKGF